MSFTVLLEYQRFVPLAASLAATILDQSQVHSLTGIPFFSFFSSDLAIAHDENDHCCHSCRHGLFVTGSRLKGSHVRVVQDLVVGRKL